MASTRDLNKVLYAANDFDGYVDDALARMQVKFASSYNDFVVGSLGILLVDMVSNGLANLNFAVDRRASDLYLETSRTPKSITKLTSQLGYKLSPASASSTDLQVNVSASFDFPITIPKGFQFRGPNNLVFEAAQDVTIPIRSTDPVEVPVYEGETVVETFVSNGAENQAFALRAIPESKFIVKGSPVVLVDGASFEEAEFLQFGDTDQFEIVYSDDPPTLVFGDGVTGSIPTVAATITITYIASRGLQGQVNENTITEVVTPLTVSFQEIPLTITNSQGSSGGDDPESFTKAKAQAGKVFKTRQVAVTQSDYETLAGAYADPVYGKVSVAKAIPTRTSSSDVEVQTQSAIITNAMSFKPAVDIELDEAVAKLDNIDTTLTSLQTELSAIATLMSDMNTQDLTNAQTKVRTMQKTQLDTLPLAQSVSSIANDGIGQVLGITSGSPSQLTSIDKDTINSFFSRIATQGANLQNTLNQTLTDITFILAKISTALDKIDQVGEDLTTSGTHLYTSDQYRASIQTDAGVDDASGIRGDLATISTLIVDATETVNVALAKITDHVEAILSADCKTNLITVPILARNFAGFYATPSSGLIRSLQTYLDARKEVTQTVKVISGSQFLIGAVLTIRLGVSVGSREAVVAKTVDTLVDGILRDRKFGKGLFVSDLVKVIKDLDGVSFVNVTINGHLQDPANTSSSVLSTKVDTTGNLIILPGEVITKGVTTINTEVAT